MAESHVISGLVKRCAELQGERKHHLQTAKAVGKDIETLEAAIKLLDPHFNLGVITPRKKRKANEFFGHGESTRFVLDTLRESDKPVSTIGLGDRVIASKGLELSREDRKRLDACILTTVSRQRSKGVVVEAGRGVDGTIEWVLASS